MRQVWTVVILVGLGAVGLSGCYVVSPYTYPAAVPVHPAPAYVPPSARGPSPPPPGGPATPPPAGGSSAPAPGAPAEDEKNCQTVTVEGHNETRVMPSGARETIWVPTHGQRICQ
jgi:hypothetical protein